MIFDVPNLKVRRCPFESAVPCHIGTRTYLLKETSLSRISNGDVMGGQRNLALSHVSKYVRTSNEIYEAKQLEAHCCTQ